MKCMLGAALTHPTTFLIYKVAVQFRLLGFADIVKLITLSLHIEPL